MHECIFCISTFSLLPFKYNYIIWIKFIYSSNRKKYIESKYILLKFHHKTTILRQIFSSLSCFLLLAKAVLITDICPKNLGNLCSRKLQNGNGPTARMNQPSDITSSSCIHTTGTCITNMQDFGHLIKQRKLK